MKAAEAAKADLKKQEAVVVELLDIVALAVKEAIRQLEIMTAKQELEAEAAAAL
jgi:hypothetical protein